MKFLQEPPAHYRTLFISTLISTLAAAVMGWLAASFDMRSTLNMNTTRIGQLQVDMKSLADASKRAPTRDEFSAFQQTELQHWSEQHDFFVRQDARTDEIVRDHAHILAMIDAHEKAAKKRVSQVAIWP